MEVDSFLKKFQGRTEVIGRQRILGIMNNVHINVNDYQLPNKKQKNLIFFIYASKFKQKCLKIIIIIIFYFIKLIWIKLEI